MDIEARLAMSFYQIISTISEEHKIYVVKHTQTNKIYIKKELTVYNREIYDYLRLNPIPNTPKIYELYEEDHVLSVIEEYVSGDTIEQLIQGNTYISNDAIREIIVQLCVIVQKLHNCNPAIIHRDIKPSNVILSPSGQIFLLDFNAAKYHSNSKSEDTELLGTKGYAAPEQYGFGVSTVQTDIYALGMLINELISSRPYLNNKAQKEFAPIIAKCTQLNPNERYKDISALLRVLNRHNMSSNINENTHNLPNWLSFLPPGFRSLSPVKMIIASGVYAFIIYISLFLKVKDSNTAQLIIDKVFLLLMFLSVIFCSANYKNMQFAFPPCRTRNIFIRIISVALLDVLIVLSYTLVIFLLNMIFM